MKATSAHSATTDRCASRVRAHEPDVGSAVRRIDVLDYAETAASVEGLLLARSIGML
jgi:hypothetical protein